MSPLWKLTFLKNNLRNLIFIGIFSVVTVSIFSFTGNSCGIEHVFITNEIRMYEKTLDPEMCEMIVEKIDLFNDSCEPQIEILDCG